MQPVGRWGRLCRDFEWKWGKRDSGNVLYAPESVQAYLRGVFNTHHGPRWRFVPQNVPSGGALGKNILEFKFKIIAKNNSELFSGRGGVGSSFMST